MMRNITGYGKGPFISVHNGFQAFSTWTNLLPGSDRIGLGECSLPDYYSETNRFEMQTAIPTSASRGFRTRLLPSRSTALAQNGEGTITIPWTPMGSSLPESGVCLSPIARE
jgi:hypothetical protein